MSHDLHPAIRAYLYAFPAQFLTLIALQRVRLLQIAFGMRVNVASLTHRKYNDNHSNTRIQCKSI